MSDCADAIAFEMLVAYWANDLIEADAAALEDHLMGCPACTAESSRIAQLAHSLRELLPPLLRPEQLPLLRARGLVIEDNPMSPGERREVRFRPGVDILLHRLQARDLEQAEHVRFTLRDEDSGSVLAEVLDAPFDRARGEVLLACQTHYAFMPHNTVAELELSLLGGDTRQARFTILHRFG